MYINMISDETRTNRLRRHMKLKHLYEARLEHAVSAQDKDHLKARIVEIGRDIVATKGDSVKEEKLEGVVPPKPKVLLPAITKTAEDDSKVVHPHKTKRSGQRKVGNPF